jgi:Sulfatase
MARSSSFLRIEMADLGRVPGAAWRGLAHGTSRRVTFAVLKLLLLVTFIGITNAQGADRIIDFWLRGHALGLVVLSGIWVLSLAAVAIVAFLPSVWARLLWSIPIGISTFAGVLAFDLTRAPLTFFDVALYWAERSHMADAMEFYSTWFWTAGGKTLIGIAAILLPPVVRLPFPRALIFAPAAPIVVIGAMIYVGDGRGTKALPQQFGGVAMMSALAISNPFGESGSRLPVQLAPRGAGAVRHVFLIVDESVRADFLDLNEPRGITPYLLSQGARIANFGYAVSGNNCSLFSNLILRYGGVRERLAESIRTYPSIWSFAKAAGYRTTYLDAQMSGGKLQDGMTVVERQQIDAHEQFDQVPGPERDVLVARRLLEIAGRAEPQFVYVNKWGAHFPFSANYPHESATFVPHMDDGEAVGDSRERLVNSYKNSLRYNLDGFFREMLQSDLEDVAVIYTSDHGLSLLDRGVLTHCNSVNPHEFEALVPLLAVSGDPGLQQRFVAAARVNRDRASHFQIFPTLLELLGFDRVEVRAAYGAGLFERIDQGDRAFSFGPVTGRQDLMVQWRSMPADLRAFVRTETVR